MLRLSALAADGVAVRAEDVRAQGSSAGNPTPNLGLVHAARTAGQELEVEGGSAGEAVAGPHVRLQRR